ncbi:MAG TPA: hydrogenase 3 maturation endopeptidase HyCI [Candidatus Hydrogenedentes bacterium]|nr:hydrogenase 3 maturation endopeptidase HyCI [Candidatus Hydrogenedentota bacterium]
MSPRTVLVGVGNVLRGDDGAGPALVDAIRNRCPCVCIDAGHAPENHLGQIVRSQPDTIIFADAVDMQLDPGQWRLFPARELVGVGFHTHTIPLGQLLDFLSARTGARAYVLGIQSGSVALGEPLSREVNDSLHEIAEIAADSCL